MVRLARVNIYLKNNSESLNDKYFDSGSIQSLKLWTNNLLWVNIYYNIT